ncbi:hypothetical protein B5C34_15720 [Pacificimonas flava]|uniref:peptidylprolyl isomerase n=2 Tax=Pacificimonas TaxID=1960290 RepID=A0A219B0V8_9SPHN|nr:hypothetical protein B5C34_15720 [Pacificimonas flava]
MGAGVQVELLTGRGPVTVEVYPEAAPASAGDFLRYVDLGLYDGGAFYRAVRADNDRAPVRVDLVQGGLVDFSLALEPVPYEPTNETGIEHRDGVVSLARNAPGTGSAANFFISIGRNPAFDFGGARQPDGQGFAAFGRIVGGMDIVRSIHREETGGAGEGGFEGQMLTHPVRIVAARRSVVSD